MRRWIRLAGRLYPRRWRERYGDEFDALLEDVGAGPVELADVMRGAVKMQLRKGSYWKLVAGMAVACAIVAFAISFRLPERYVSTAVVKVEGATFTERSLQEMLSRSALSEIIQRPSLDLYRPERQRIPMEDVIQQMRTRDIRVHRSANTVQFSFAAPDPVKAQTVTDALLTRFTEGERYASRRRALVWQQVWPQSSAPAAGTIEILNPASLPEEPAGSNRLPFVAAGLGVGLCVGLCVGLLAAITKRRPKVTLRMMAFAAGGCAAGVAVAFLLPATYVSTAVIRITPALVPETPGGSTAPPPLAERLLPLQQQIQSRNNNVRIRPVGTSAFQISFSGPDAGEAQAVVREFVTQFVKLDATAARDRTKGLKEGDPIRIIQENRAGSNLQVLDSASYPQSPISPNRAVITGLGIALGLMLGALTLMLSARSQRQPAPGSC